VTPLIAATMNGNIQIITWLLGKGATVNKTNNIGWTALHVASIQNSKAIAKLLLTYGSNVYAVNLDGMTPRDIASKEILEIIDESTNYGRLNIYISRNKEYFNIQHILTFKKK